MPGGSFSYGTVLDSRQSSPRAPLPFGRNDLTYSTMKRFFTPAETPSASPFTAGRTLIFNAAHLIAAVLLTASCIYDSPDDQFYRTLWVSKEAPFGNADDIAGYGLNEGQDDRTVDGSVDDSGSADGLVDDSTDGSATGDSLLNCGKLTIEFLCGGSVSVTAPGAIGSYGTYDTHGTTAYFANLRLSYYIDGPDNAPLVIVLEEAHRTDDLLLLSWHYFGSPVSYTTRLVRKGSYE